jgi:uncharacterized membrane protein
VTPGLRRRLGVALAVVLSVGFAVLAHGALVQAFSPALGAAVSLVPVALLLWWALRQSRLRHLALLAIAAVAVALWLGWAQLERHFPGLFFVEHAGANLLLAIVFGRTLVAGREALCTRFARILHPQLPPEVERYTRQVTVAWTIFFLALFAVSCALYFGGWLEAWSLLANLVSPLLVGAMFVIEYAVRHRVLPHWHRIGVIGTVNAFTRHFQAQRAPAR